MNKFFVIAALGANPELRFTPSGTAVLELLLAGERHIVGNDGKARTLPFYIRSEALGKMAENLNERGYQQGDVLLIDGTAEYAEWNDRNIEGAKASTIRLKPIGTVRKLEGDFQVTQDSGGNTRLMGGVNRVQLVGNLAADVEVKDTTSGPVATLRLAVNEKYKTREGQPMEKTHWFRVSVWREQAEAMRGQKKGAAVYVEGALNDDEWKDDQGRDRKSKIIEAESVAVIAAFSGTARPQGQPASAPTRSAQSSPARPTQQRAPSPQASTGMDLPPEAEDLPF